MKRYKVAKRVRRKLCSALIPSDYRFVSAGAFGHDLHGKEAGKTYIPGIWVKDNNGLFVFKTLSDAIDFAHYVLNFGETAEVWECECKGKKDKFCCGFLSSQSKQVVLTGFDAPPPESEIYTQVMLTKKLAEISGGKRSKVSIDDEIEKICLNKLHIGKEEG